MSDATGMDMMKDKSSFLITGALIGAAGVLLSYLGNPANTGICISCFLEQTAGALGLHDNVRMQCLRPELLGFVLGSFLSALAARRFSVIAGSSPLLRFFVGALLIAGCSLFIGCPVKMVLRLAAGDLSAMAGAGGLCAGVWVGIQFLQNGFMIGKPSATPAGNGYLIPACAILLLALLFWGPSFLNQSVKGSGAQHAPAGIALALSMTVGWFAQRSGFCITGGVARIFLWGPKEVLGCPKSTGMLLSVASFFFTALIASLLTGRFTLGLHGQPSSNESYLWNFLGMTVVGFGSVLIKGCPFRQLVLAGQGDADAGAAVLGMFAGAAIVERWGLSGTAAGTPEAGKLAALAALIFLLLIGLVYRERKAGLAPEFQRGLE